jgi:hypothetical protein
METIDLNHVQELRVFDVWVVTYDLSWFWITPVYEKRTLYVTPDYDVSAHDPYRDLYVSWDDPRERQASGHSAQSAVTRFTYVGEGEVHEVRLMDTNGNGLLDNEESLLIKVCEEDGKFRFLKWEMDLWPDRTNWIRQPWYNKEDDSETLNSSQEEAWQGAHVFGDGRNVTTRTNYFELDSAVHLGDDLRSNHFNGDVFLLGHWSIDLI